MITPQNASVAIAALGDNTVITGISGVQLRILRVVLVNRVATAQSCTLKDGAATSLTGAMALPSSIGGSLTLGDGQTPLLPPLSSGNAFIMNLSIGVQVSGSIWYQYG